MALKKIKILFLFVLTLLLVPLIQQITGLIKVKSLSGAIVDSPTPIFNLNKWIEGEYQTEAESFLNEQFGFRAFFIRLNNQLNYSLYHKAKANGVIIGKEGFLFEEGYINAHYGNDFIGEAKMDSLLYKIDFLTAELRKKNISLVVVLEPGKANFYPEYIPDKFVKKAGTTNIRYFTEKAKNHALSVLDLHSYFNQQKKQSPYPLFTKCGIHWSTYCEVLARDTLMKYLSAVTQKPLPLIQFNGGFSDNALHYRDADLAEGMNLLVLPDCGIAWYPNYSVLETDRTKVKSMVVGDSFYWGFFNGPDITKLFENPEFWYYYKELYSTKWKGPKLTSDIDLKTQIEKQEVVLIMLTDANMNNVGFGFVDDAYMLYKKSEKQLLP